MPVATYTAASFQIPEIFGPRMRLLLVIPTVHGGGAEQVAAVLAREWGAAGHDLRVVAWHVGRERLDFGVPIEDLGLPASPRLAGKLKAFLRRVACLRRIVRAFRPDAVLAFMDEAGLVCTAAALCDGWRERLIVSMHHNPQWLSASRRRLLRLAYRVPARVVGVSQGVRAEMARSLGLAPQRLCSIPNPLVLRDDEGEAGCAAVAARFGRGFVLFVGRLDRHTKGLDILLEAWAQLSMPHPPLVFVGDGGDRAWLDAEIRQRGFSDVHCVGWQADPQPFYRRAGLFVMCSRYEGWSNVLLEAMGQGCPVVAADCPHGPAEMLGEALGRQLLPVGDATALAAAMRRELQRDEVSRADLAQALRMRAREYAAPAIAARWIALARGLAGTGAA